MCGVHLHSFPLLCTISFFLYLFHETDGGSFSEKRRIHMTSYWHCWKVLSSGLQRYPPSPKTSFAESRAGALPEGTLLGYICVGRPPGVSNGPSVPAGGVCERQEWILLTGMFLTASMTIEGRGTKCLPHAGAPPRRTRVRWRRACAQVSSAGSNTQHICKGCSGHA